jgi:hypothetical protein
MAAVEITGSGTQQPEQIGLFLRMMQALGKGFDVVDHRPRQRHIERRAAGHRLVDKVQKPAHHGRQRTVLVQDEGQRRLFFPVRLIALDGRHQYRKRRAGQHFLGLRPLHQATQALVAVRGHEDQVAAQLFRHGQNGRGRAVAVAD